MQKNASHQPKKQIIDQNSNHSPKRASHQAKNVIVQKYMQQDVTYINIIAYELYENY